MKIKFMVGINGPSGSVMGGTKMIRLQEHANRLRRSDVLEKSRPVSFREDASSLLFRLFLSVANECELDLAEVLNQRVDLDNLAKERRIAAVQASGIWSQLLDIVGKTHAIRRETEQAGGANEIVGSSFKAIGRIAARSGPGSGAKGSRRSLRRANDDDASLLGQPRHRAQNPPSWLPQADRAETAKMGIM